MKLRYLLIIILSPLFIFLYLFIDPHNLFSITYEANIFKSINSITEKNTKPLYTRPELNTQDYDARMIALAHNPITTGSSSSSTLPLKKLWPVTSPYPLGDALLPFNRIIAYYGNFYSTKMGVLGEYPQEQMLTMLQQEVDKWEQADPTTPVIPAIHYIAMTAQAAPGTDGMYRIQMPDSQIDKAVSIAQEIKGITILDLQIGLSTFEKEIPKFEKYLALPEVHLGLDPEFSMKTGARPGTVIGSMDANDINYATQYLADLVQKNNLPPKILVIHRFTQNMIKNYQDILLRPEVQIVIDMDGWGPPANKINTYKSFIYPEPVQFTGFKLFYKNDLREPSTRMLTPQELLNLSPRPIYIQYQ